MTIKPSAGLIIVLFCVVVAVYFGVSNIQKIGSNQGYEPTQPIKFSHKTHAGQNKIACLYCHFAAEKGRSAGIPPTQLCMNCHSKILPDSPEIQKIVKAIDSNEGIKWNKVHALPDHAYFNHSQHVINGKVSCQTCHGAVETMSRVKQEKNMSMGWCLDCHRASGIASPNESVSKTGANCASCHY